MAYTPPVPTPHNRNLKKVRPSDGASPTQDGPHKGTTLVSGNLLPYMRASSPLYSWLKGLTRAATK